MIIHLLNYRADKYNIQINFYNRNHLLIFVYPAPTEMNLWLHLHIELESKTNDGINYAPY